MSGEEKLCVETCLSFYIRDLLSWVLCCWKLDKSHLKAQKCSLQLL